MNLIRKYNKGLNRKGVFSCPKCGRTYHFNLNYGLNKKECKRCTGILGKKLTKKKALTIRKRYKKGNISLRKLAKEYNISHNTVWLIVKYQIWNI